MSPFQLFQQGSTYARGERMLLAELLASCLRDLLRPGGRLKRRAEAWLRSDDRGEITFPRVCELLGLDPDSIRAQASEYYEVVRTKRFAA